MKKLKKVTKFKRRVKFNVVPKILLVISCFVFVFAFAFSSYAYSYNPQTGNLSSDNVLDAPQSFDVCNSSTTSNPSIYSAYVLPNTEYTLTFTKFRIYNVEVSDPWIYTFNNIRFLAYSSSTSDITSISGTALRLTDSYDVSYTFTTPNLCNYLLIDFSNRNNDSNVNTRVVNSMIFDSSKSLTSYEPYGIEWYSSTQYNNYGSSKYSEGYNDGVNDTLDSLSNMEIGYLHSGVGLGVYDSTNSYLLYRGTLTTIDNVGTGVNLDWSLDTDTNIYYRIVVSFNDNYIFKNIKWSPNRFSYASLTYGTNQITNVSYNGSYYGFFDLDETDISGYSSFTLNVKITNHSGWDGFNLYVDALNLNLADAQAIAEQNYNNGYDAGYEEGYSTSYNQGFSDGVKSIQDSNANYKTLIWTIASTPWESFKHIWSFDILGLNIANIVIGFIMVLLLIYLIKKIWR